MYHLNHKWFSTDFTCVLNTLREIPPELRRGTEVFLTMEDRRHEEFNKIFTGSSKPFRGKGHMLGRYLSLTLIFWYFNLNRIVILIIAYQK